MEEIRGGNGRKSGEMGGNGGTWRNLKEIRGGNGRKSGGEKIKLKELGGTWRNWEELGGT